MEWHKGRLLVTTQRSQIVAFCHYLQMLADTLFLPPYRWQRIRASARSYNLILCRTFWAIHAAAWRHIIRPVFREGFLSTCAPRGCSALARVLEADNVVDVNEVIDFVGVEAYGGVRLITAVAEVFAFIAVCIGEWDCPYSYWAYED